MERQGCVVEAVDRHKQLHKAAFGNGQSFAGLDVKRATFPLQAIRLAECITQICQMHLVPQTGHHAQEDHE
eukprot:7787232-Lingulodinium_polyedra.AAC.1